MKTISVLISLLFIVGCTISAPKGKKGGAFIHDVRIESDVLIITRCHAAVVLATVYATDCAEEKISLKEEK